MGVMSVLLMVALSFFVFNPLGLGPEPRYLRNYGNEKLNYIRKCFEAHFSLVS